MKIILFYFHSSSTVVMSLEYSATLSILCLPRFKCRDINAAMPSRIAVKMISTVTIIKNVAVGPLFIAVSEKLIAEITDDCLSIKNY